LIHWDIPEAEARAARLESLGYAATFYNRAGPGLLRALRDDPPSAVLIDLSRLPAQGRDVALELRASPATRGLPLVFVDGLPEKVLLVRQSLPDATYSTWTHVGEDLPRAISRAAREAAARAALAKPALAPVKPTRAQGPASPEAAPLAPPAPPKGRSVAGKLGIQPGTVVALLSAPNGFDVSLEPLPQGASLRRQMDPEVDLSVWFVRSRRDLADGLALRASRLARGKLWILWPKKSSGHSGELSAENIKTLAAAQGLAGEKSASIDSDWTGMLFERTG
jgi:hypothetical protein